MPQILTYLLGVLGMIYVGNSPCTSTISPNKRSFGPDEPIYISYSIKNVSKDTVQIWHCGFWCNNRIVVTDQHDIEIPRTDWGAETRRRFSPGRPRDKNVPITLAPGEIDSAYEKVNLKDYFKFEKAGRYKVRYYYEERDDKGEIKMESNILQFDVSG
ncbi:MULTISPECIES: hypothetical protein [unclassified Flavobacterium]|uniref:hypothetical protein n=1 Tax=unclassified Flavobacterium TaxID=196869 RepID=UPI001F145C72|nr:MULTISPECIES: hypothetical protein [unclassified Flavobacterium]UMY64546.1 hypothetical protein MKO97_08480 [Flavobacterium sp. HJ-32-4]